MTNFYVDTSAVNKRYIAETGSTWVRRWIRRRAGNLIMISDLTAVESFSIYARLHREQRISITRQRRLRSLFIEHMRQHYVVLPLTQAVLLEAQSLVSAHPLKAADAIQLATALQARRIWGQPITFVTADKQLRTAAFNENFTVENPNLYP